MKFIINKKNNINDVILNHKQNDINAINIKFDKTEVF